jgi:hypothetical protein
MNTATSTQPAAPDYPSGRSARFLVEFEAHQINAKVDAVASVGLPLTHGQVADVLIQHTGCCGMDW